MEISCEIKSFYRDEHRHDSPLRNHGRCAGDDDLLFSGVSGVTDRLLFRSAHLPLEVLVPKREDLVYFVDLVRRLIQSGRKLIGFDAVATR